MNAIRIHCISPQSLERTYFTPNVIYQENGKDLLFNNTLFDTVLFVSAKDESAAHRFVQELELGCNDIITLIKETFNLDARSIYSLLVNKKVVE